ncbi:MAG: TlpA family protein disulfide reductase [Anaerolineales bacterium]|nr:MAG: TlpA family protein disulfide reductase [Anaerolineales bacterium]
MTIRRLLPGVLILGLILSGCTATQLASPAVMADVEDAMMDDDAMKEDQENMVDAREDDMPSDDLMAETTSDDMLMVPGWFSAQLVDVHTGETFSIRELSGQVVLVETMAVWCSNCLRQQREVLALHQALGMRDDFISIALDIDSNEDAGKLRDFAAQQGFDWLYAVAPVDVANQIGELYGQQFLNPPSTPMLLIDRHGEVHPLPFGIKSAADLQNNVEKLLDAGM